jgi:hypothetical protein
MDLGSHVGFQISTKNTNLVEDHPMNISGKFGSDTTLCEKENILVTYGRLIFSPVTDTLFPPLRKPTATIYYKLK